MRLRMGLFFVFAGLLGCPTEDTGSDPGPDVALGNEVSDSATDLSDEAKADGCTLQEGASADCMCQCPGSAEYTGWSRQPCVGEMSNEAIDKCVEGCLNRCPPSDGDLPTSTDAIEATDTDPWGEVVECCCGDCGGHHFCIPVVADLRCCYSNGTQATSIPWHCAEKRACAEGTSPCDDAPIPPPPTAEFEPIDFATGLGTTIPALRVTEAGKPVTEAMLENLRASAFLASWPSLALVPAQFAVEGGSGIWRVVGVPDAALADGWFVVGVKPWPNDVRGPGSSGAVALEGGGYGARFRTDSSPRVWGSDGCNKSSSSSSVYIGFTEKVKGDYARAVKVAGCEAAVLSGPLELFQNVMAKCPALKDGDNVIVDFEPGLQSESGKPLTDAAGNTAFQWTFTTHMVGTECWMERAPDEVKGPTLAIVPNNLVIFCVGDSRVRNLTTRNDGDSPLSVLSVDLWESTPDAEPKWFSLETATSSGAAVGPWVLGPGESVVSTVICQRPGSAGAEEPAAHVTIKTNLPGSETSTVAIGIAHY